MQTQRIVIAIDGYSSCGKSTFAKAIAQRMGYLYIDSGAMYRAVTLACMEAGIIANGRFHPEGLAALLPGVRIGFTPSPTGPGWVTTLNGQAVEAQIRSLEVAQWVSHVAAQGVVRGAMVEQQRQLGQAKGIVMDGRDIGTVVFPDAELKIFMTADPLVRAHRRLREMQAKGEAASLDQVLANILERDRIDQTRAESPLRQAPGAFVLDNSHMSVEEQLEWAQELIGRATRHEPHRNP